MTKSTDRIVRCHGCKYFFITYERSRPYGCVKFGFKGKKLPATIVMETTGTQCAYRLARPSTQNERRENQRKV